MTDSSLDELGTVDYAVVEFPAGRSNLTGEMAEELLAEDDVVHLAAAMEPLARPAS